MTKLNEDLGFCVSDDEDLDVNMFLKNERREQEKFSAFKSDDEKFKEVNANASDVYAATRLRSIGIQACGEYEREIAKTRSICSERKCGRFKKIISKLQCSLRNLQGKDEECKRLIDCIKWMRNHATSVGNWAELDMRKSNERDLKTSRLNRNRHQRRYSPLKTSMRQHGENQDDLRRGAQFAKAQYYVDSPQYKKWKTEEQYFSERERASSDMNMRREKNFDFSVEKLNPQEEEQLVKEAAKIEDCFRWQHHL
eukprot:jgi/Bigna1/145601/aug1.101_g20309